MVDLLDALHFMFEDDMAPASGEQQEARQRTRAAFYTQVYGKASYDWVLPENKQQSAAGPPLGDTPALPPAAADPDTRMEHKEYIPPTPFNPDAAKPFGDVLDAPLG